MKPNFIGLGAQKCASTWLYKVMSDHPDIFVSEPKELDFFSAFFDRGYQWYESFFRATQGVSILGDISPSYLPDSDAPKRAYAYNPHFQIIICLRDPIERLISNHSHDLRLMHLTGPSLSIEHGLQNNPMYIEQSMYAKHIKNWLACFPIDQMLFLFQEEIKINPVMESKRTYEFLKVNSSFNSEFNSNRANESYIPKSREREAGYRKLGKTLDAMGFRYVADAIRASHFYQNLKERNRLQVKEIVPPMKIETRVELVKSFAADMNELASILNRQSLPWETWRSSKSL
jgi:hypothetical protein